MKMEKPRLRLIVLVVLGGFAVLVVFNWIMAFYTYAKRVEATFPWR